MSLSPCRRQRARYRRLQRHDLRGDTRGDSDPSRGLHPQMEAEASCRGRQPGRGWRTLVHLHSPTAEPMARVRTTNAIERLHEEFKRRSRRKPCCHPPTPPRCFSGRCWHQGRSTWAKSMFGCDKIVTTLGYLPHCSRPKGSLGRAVICTKRTCFSLLEIDYLPVCPPFYPGLRCHRSPNSAKRAAINGSAHTRVRPSVFALVHYSPRNLRAKYNRANAQCRLDQWSTAYER
jgi:hypothetical protein